MKKTINTSLKVTGVFVLSVLLSGRINAQPNPGPGNSGSNISTSTDGPTVPFDGGMSLMLVASGIGYVARNLKKVSIKEI